MTVSSSLSTQTFNCNGGTTVFTCPFRVLEASELVGYLITIATNESTPLVNGTDFAATGVGAANVVATTTLTYSSDYQINFRRRTQRLQSTDYRDNDPFPAESHENALDRLTHIAQESDADIGRALLAPEPEAGITLPAAVDRADRLLGFDSSGAPVALAPASGSAAELALDLASTAIGTKNAGQVGSLWTLNYAARTVGNDLRYGSVPSIFKVLTDAQQADVLAYGYVNDLTATIAAAYAISKVWYFPAGGYKISGATGLSMPANGAMLLGDGDLTVINYTGTGTAIDLNGKYYCELSRFKLVTTTGAIGVDMPFVSHFWQLDRLHITGFSTAGVRGTSCYYGTLQRCDIEQCGAGLLGVQDFNGNFINNNSFRGNIRAIWIRDVALNSDGNQIINNEIEDSGRAGVLAFIDLEGADGTIVMANRMESSVSGLIADIYIHGGTGVAGNNQVCNNYIAGSSTDVPSIKIGAGSGPGVKNAVVENNICLSATSGNVAIIVDTDASYTKLVVNRRQLGDGTFTVTNNGAATDLTFVDDATFTASITGLTTTPTALWRYRVANNVVCLSTQSLNGTSNSTACTITGLPALIRPATSQTVLVTVQESGTTQLGRGVIDSAGVITLSSTVAGAAFTASGGKGFIGCTITYPLS